MSTISIKALLSILVAWTIHNSALADVWPTKAAWTPEAEAAYSLWVENEFHEEIFVKGKYADTSTDCADAVYLARAIFAFENQLPFAIKNPSAPGALMANKTKNYDHISDPLERFKKFAANLSNNVSSRTLQFDTYPIKIEREFLRPGTVWVRPARSSDNLFGIFGGGADADPGHAELVVSIRETGVVDLISSTTPQEIRKLKITSDLVFVPKDEGSGFRAWITPDKFDTPVENLPGYSREQYEFGGVFGSVRSFRNKVYKRLQERKESREERALRIADNFCALMHERADVLMKADATMRDIRENQNRCMNAEEYDAYSTPSRDKKAAVVLKDLIRQIDGSQAGGPRSTSRRRSSKLNFDVLFAQCAPLEISYGIQMTAAQAAQKVLGNDLSSDPNQTLLARWGMEEERRHDCQLYY